MRKVLFAVLAGLVSVGISMGTASAAPMQGVSCNTGQNGLVNLGTTTCTNTSTGLLPSVTSGLLGGGIRRHWPYRGLPAGFPQLYDGNLLPLQALGLGTNQYLDVCAYRDFNSLDGYGLRNYGARWRGVDSRWFAVQRAQRMLALREAAGCGVTSVTPWQLRGSDLDLGYYGGSGYFDVCSAPTFDRFEGLVRPRFGGRWPGFERHFGGVRGARLDSYRQLHEQAGCPSVVVIPGASYSQPIVEQPQVIEQPQVVESSPCGCAPVSSPYTPQVVAPQGVPNSGNSGLAPDAEHVN